MRKQILPYVVIEIDDRWRQRLRHIGEQLRITVIAYLRSAADDLDNAGDKGRDLCDSAVERVNSVAAAVEERIAPRRPDREPQKAS